MNTTATRLATPESDMASHPLPDSTMLCAGSTANDISGSGTPRTVAGIKSMNVWVIDIEHMNTEANNGSRYAFWDIPRAIGAAVLTCMPGTSPVNVPHATPNTQYSTISKDTKKRRMGLD